MTKLGKFLRSIRLNRELSAYEMADLCKLEFEIYHEIERDPGKNAGNNLSKILSVLEVTAEEYSIFNSLALDSYKDQMDTRHTKKQPSRPNLKQVSKQKEVELKS